MLNQNNNFQEESTESVNGVLEQPVPSGRRLHEMRFVDILDAMFSLYRDYFWLFIGITAALYIPFYILRIFITRTVPEISWLMNLIENWFINPIVTGALVFAIAQEYLGRQTTIGEAFNRVKFWSILGASLLVGLAVVGIIIVPMMVFTFSGGRAIGGAILMLLVFPIVIYLAVRWSLFPQSIMVEGYTAAASLSRSRALVKGTWWRVFGIELVLWILVFLITSVPSFIIRFLTGSLQIGLIPGTMMVLIVALVTTIIATPIRLVGNTLLYFDLRIRKEAFDIEMMAKNIHGEA